MLTVTLFCTCTTMLLLALFMTAAVAAPSPVCKDAFQKAGISKNYNETIAHAIHSMTVEGLRLFDPLATEQNKIPTVNQDLSQVQKVLSNAPHFLTSSDFATQTMNILDKILSTVGNSKDGLGPHWSSVERIAHIFHMWDLWEKIYETSWPEVLMNPPEPTTCVCLKDTRANGIKAAVEWVAKHYETGTPITLLNRPIPKLTDAQTWSVWKQRLLHYYTPAALRDAAIYLYCVTHH